MAQVSEISKLPMGEHEGHKIYVDRDSGYFEIEGWDEVEGSNASRFASMREAWAEIDRVKKLDRAKQRRAAAMAVKVLTGGGVPLTVKGFHLRYGHPLFAERSFNSPPTIYPDVPWIEATLKRIAELNAEVATLMKSVQRHAIERYGRNGFNPSLGSPEAYDESCREFEATVAKRAEEARNAQDGKDRGAA